MALVWSRQHNIYKSKWNHSCQPRWRPVSHDILVQERNCLNQARHIWQGDTPKISAHMIRTAMSAEWDHPQIGPWGNSLLVSRGAKTLIKRPRGWSALLSGAYLRPAADHCRDSRAPLTRVLLHATPISLGLGYWRPCPAGLRTLPTLLPTWLWRSFLARH